MQNLNTLGYRDAINKKRGLSPKHVRLALDEMAKYHALGYAWMRNYPGGVEQALKDEEVRNNSHLMLTRLTIQVATAVALTLKQRVCFIIMTLN